MPHPKIGAETRRLQLHILNQLRTLDAFGPAGKVFHQRGDRELAAGLVTFNDQRLEVGARGIDRRCKSGTAGAEDDGVADVLAIEVESLILGLGSCK